MNFNFLKRLSTSAALGLALLTGGAAHAGFISVNVDVTGIKSNDEWLSGANEMRQIFITPFAHIVSIGWDVNLTADQPSWLSDIAVDVSDGVSGSPNGFFLTPGLGTDTWGTAPYNGFVDLISVGLDFYLTGTGLLHMEFFEHFKDIAGNRDGIWNSGALRIGAVPEPGSIALVALALAAAGAASRRRAQSA